MPAISNEMAGEWQEYDFGEVRDHIVEAAQPLDITALQATATEARESVETAKGEIESILAAYTKAHPDELAEKLREQASVINVLSEQQIQQASYPRGSIMSRDGGSGLQQRAQREDQHDDHDEHRDHVKQDAKRLLLGAQRVQHGRRKTSSGSSASEGRGPSEARTQ